MTTNLYTLLIFLVTISSFAQKKEIYLDGDLISNDDLIKINQNKSDININGFIYFNFRFDLDTLILNVKVKRKKKGKIRKKTLDSIKSEISIMSGKTIPDGDVIVINYYHGKDRCNSTGNRSHITSRYRKFSKKINKNKNISQFFIYKSPEGLNKFGKKIHWIRDGFRRIERLFLPLNYPCGSYVLIDENGNYYVQKGEYAIEEIIDLLKDDKTTFANDNSSRTP